ncbi:MAG: hypothetical protein JWN51_3188 [Phycisphaerales bacterium]|nr:hypothetical protein [Phycisphaerales bacterium]
MRLVRPPHPCRYYNAHPVRAVFDTIGDSGADFIIGWAGNDTLVGGAWNDPPGIDALDFSSHVAFGGPGDDILGSTTGTSKLYGGTGKDEFAAVPAEVKDRQSGEPIKSPMFARPG